MKFIDCASLSPRSPILLATALLPVLLFLCSPTAAAQLHEQAKLLASDGRESDRFGVSLAIDNGLAVIEAHYDDDRGHESGSAYVFHCLPESGEWLEVTKMLPSDGEESDRFAYSVSLSSRTALVGSYFDHNQNGSFAGSAYVFDLSETLGPPLHDIKIDGQDGPLSFPSNRDVNMTIDLDPGYLAGIDHDWWIIAENSGGKTFSWNYYLAPRHWVAGVQRAYAGPLVPIGQHSIHNGTIPAGSWTFTFALDPLDNIYEGTYSDSILVTSY